VQTVGRTRDNSVKIATETSSPTRKNLWKGLKAWIKVTEKNLTLSIFVESANNWAPFVETVISLYLSQHQLYKQILIARNHFFNRFKFL
jgi:hypothetical protein